jgi:16S rRNA (guanine966-N2)-methyltransferase
MRIIAGEFKGRLINVPDSKLIRPMTDRVRETLFNLLNNRIDFKNIKVLDLYSGSGALGLECLSRGAAEIHFVEKDFLIARNLKENIESLDASEKCTIHRTDALKFSTMPGSPYYNLILADPPFFKDDIYEVSGNIMSNNFLAAGGLMVIERSVQTREKDILNFKAVPFKIIGDACLYEVKN